MKGDGGTEKILKKLEANVYIKEFLDGALEERHTALVTDNKDGAVNLNIINTAGKKLPVTGSSAMLFLAGTGIFLLASSIIYRHRKSDNCKNQ